MTQSTRPVGPGDHVFLVDGSSFVFRAYFQSIRQDQKYNYRSDRLPVGAVRLFATKVLQFLRDGAAGIKPTHLAIIFDKSENSFRREIYPLYKAHRPDPPDDLVPQFPLMRETVRAFGLTPIEQDRYEADDLIATYARQARERGADVLIVSADKDLMQLIEPGVAMFDPASGDREERRIGPDEVVAYFGAGADKVVDIQALAGNSTDNVPGARGIGVKTAAQLIGEYGDLDTLLERANEIKQPKRREALTDPKSVALIRLSKTLVTLVRDVDVRGSARYARRAQARRRAADRVPQGDGVHHNHSPRRRNLRRRRQCGRTRRAFPRPGRLARAQRRDDRAERCAARRVDRRAAAPATETAAAPAPAPTGARPPRASPPSGPLGREKKRSKSRPTQTVTSVAELERWIGRAFEAGLVAFDTETTSLDPLQADLVGVSLAVAPGEACYIPIGHRAGAADLFGGGGLSPARSTKGKRSRCSSRCSKTRAS